MALILIEAPEVEPVTLAEAKLHLRVDNSTDDVLIEALITAARQFLETMARPQLAMITQTWQYIADKWPSSVGLELRPYPLQSVDEISYTDEAGTEATFASSNYLVDTVSEPGRLRLRSSASWPSVTLQELNGLVVEFTAGFGDDGSAVPAPLRQALLLLVAHWYENREIALTTGATASEIPFTVRALMAPWRREV